MRVRCYWSPSALDDFHITLSVPTKHLYGKALLPAKNFRQIDEETPSQLREHSPSER